ncbi:MAG TPA: 30S ribosomal protein S4 [Anaerolineae bacterium]|nr:30S ribosomal protein S4 [Anaerolineae bacterium]HOV47689.1 30S ribosomal protein S4 [Anaerolineae bacterium]HPD42203.1 30S ribosomal protein S4 [Anaerolineae bacterium]HRT30806.1 30S ribosomal protein S4 [Anaerolineae bacterium]HRU94886.1 30S ribosomal protein S4 [Anaerolineae bacterium]
MARYLGPACKLCRREGAKLYLKGDKCYTEKCPFEARAFPPGQHGREAGFRKRTATNYTIQLREKQKVRRIYGVLERQFRRYFREAQRRPGLTGENLLVLLETRLDNIVYRLGFADSRSQARQLVEHGHFTVNGRKVTIPSYVVRVGDAIAVRPESRRRPYFKDRRELLGKRNVPAWLALDEEQPGGRVLALPTRQEIDVPVQEQLIVEFYSR